MCQFDGLPKTPSTIPIPNPVDGIRFEGISYISPSPPLNIPPTSKPNLAVFGLLAVLLGQNTPIKTIAADFPKVKYFSLESLNIGCSVSNTGNVPELPPVPKPPTVASIPQSCIVSFVGKSSKGKTISQRCSFSGLRLALEPCTFNRTEFADISTLRLDVEDALTLPNTTSVSFDNVRHVNYI